MNRWRWLLGLWLALVTWRVLALNGEVASLRLASQQTLLERQALLEGTLGAWIKQQQQLVQFERGFSSQDVRRRTQASKPTLPLLQRIHD